MLGTVFSAGVVAATPSTTIEWDASQAGCPSQAEVDERVAVLLGPHPASVRAHASATEYSTGWQATLRLSWRGHTDEQTLRGPDCASLADAVTLLVAVMADPVQTARTLHERSLVPPPPRVVPPLLPVAAAEQRADAPAPRRDAGEPTPAPAESVIAPHDTGPSLAVSGMVDVGSTPRAAPGVALSFAWRRRRWRAQLEGFYLPPVAVASSAPYASRGRVQLAAARVGGCTRLGSIRWEVPICGGAEGGGVIATGFGLDGRGNTLKPWLAGTLSGGLLVRLNHWFSIAARLEAVVPVFRGRYQYGDDLLHETAPVAARAGLGVEFRWSFKKQPVLEND